MDWLQDMEQKVLSKGLNIQIWESAADPWVWRFQGYICVCVLSLVWLFTALWTVARQALVSMVLCVESRVGCHFLLPGIFPSKGSNLSFLHWQVSLYYWATWEVKGMYDGGNHALSSARTAGWLLMWWEMNNLQSEWISVSHLIGYLFQSNRMKERRNIRPILLIYQLY